MFFLLLNLFQVLYLLFHLLFFLYNFSILESVSTFFISFSIATHDILITSFATLILLNLGISSSFLSVLLSGVSDFSLPFISKWVPCLISNPKVLSFPSSSGLSSFSFGVLSLFVILSSFSSGILSFVIVLIFSFSFGVLSLLVTLTSGLTSSFSFVVPISSKVIFCLLTLNLLNLGGSSIIGLPLLSYFTSFGFSCSSLCISITLVSGFSFSKISFIFSETSFSFSSISSFLSFGETFSFLSLGLTFSFFSFGLIFSSLSSGLTFSLLSLGMLHLLSFLYHSL